MLVFPKVLLVFRKEIIFHVRSYSKIKKSNLNALLLKMPKEPKHVAEIQKQRLKNKEKSSRFAPGKVSLQVLGTGAKGAPRTLYIFSDQTRYLFNCGEGTQRLAHELKLKLAKLEHIFITHPIWQNVGGLPGAALTMQDVGVPNITLHGPSGLREMFDATKKFVVLKNLKINIAQSTPHTTFEDNVLKVKYIPLDRRLEEIPENSNDSNKNGIIKEDENKKNSQVGRTSVDIDAGTCSNFSRRKRRSRSISSDQSGHIRRRPKKRKRKNERYRSISLEPGTSSYEETLDELYQVTKDKGISMAYICQLQPRPGALCLEKCVNFGVPPGPLLGKLKAGEDVQLANGNIVKSSDVCEPDDPGPVFIVIDCPTEEYIDSLLECEDFKKHQRFAKSNEDVASVVIHFTPKRVMEDSRYQKWVDDFIPSTQHLILNETNTCMGSESVHRIQYKLNLLDNEIFPLLGDSGTEIQDEIAESTLRKCNDNNGLHSFRNVQANTLTAVHLRPRKGLDRSEEIKLTPEKYVGETMTIDGFSKLLTDTKDLLVAERISVKSNTGYPKVLFLGTGSCIPNKTRNTSGILVAVDPELNIILDSGEGTYGQLVRFFGPEKSDEILVNLGAIYISHLHADHHIGLVGVLQGRRRALKKLNKSHKPLYLFAPLQMFPWLTFYDRCLEHIKPEFEFIANHDLVMNNKKMSEYYNQQVLKDLKLKKIETCFVRHCPNAFGLSLEFSTGSKITYSGDTMPCDDLVELGKNSDLLIHEATMEDELAHEAVTKMHSTTSQAIEIGRRMEAKYILLTHFSQRYAKLPRFNDSFSFNVGVAFDNMMVKLDELRLVNHFNPALKVMFAEHYEELEQKAAKRQLRLEKEHEHFVDRQKILKVQ